VIHTMTYFDKLSCFLVLYKCQFSLENSGVDEIVKMTHWYVRMTVRMIVLCSITR
jgi:hypothetical protein